MDHGCSLTCDSLFKVEFALHNLLLVALLPVLLLLLLLLLSCRILLYTPPITAPSQQSLHPNRDVLSSGHIKAFSQVFIGKSVGSGRYRLATPSIASRRGTSRSGSSA
eukprot:2816675-Rhodomonas_salina.3